MPLRPSIHLFFGFLITSLLFSCHPVSDTPHSGLLIVTTTGHIADLVRNVAGDKASVVSLMGPGVDPHLYKASLSDLKQLQEADLIFYNGLHLEGKMGEVFHKLSRTKRVTAISADIPEDSLLKTGPESNAHDPHIWFDVMLWSYCLDKVKKELISADPENRDYYESNAEVYKQKLLELHTQIEQTLERIPEKERLLVTAHDAFGYYGRRYKVEVIGLQGISTLSEYGLREITQLSSLLIARKIRAVYVETSVSDKAIQSVIEGCRQKGHHVRIGGSLYSDALGAPGTPEEDYIGMQLSNLRMIYNGLK